MNSISRRRFIGSAAAASAIPLIGSSAYAQRPPGRTNRSRSSPAIRPAGRPICSRAPMANISGEDRPDDRRRKQGRRLRHRLRLSRSSARAPDGYTLMFTISTTMIMNRVLIKEIPYDAEKDFILDLDHAGGQPAVRRRRQDRRKDAYGVCRLRKKTEKVNIGTYAAGSYAHMAIVEMNKQYGLKMEPVHYRGEAPMWTDLAGGFIDGAHRQLRRGVAGAPERPRPCGRRLAPAHFAIARRSDLHGAGRDLAPVPVHRFPMLRRAGRDAAGNRSEALRSSLVAGGKSEKVQQVMKTFGVDDTAMTLRGDAETLQGRSAGLA